MPKRAEENGRARIAALEALLFADPDAPPPGPAALASALRSILDRPEMERIDHRAAVEDWLAGLLCRAIPRSDPIIPMAVARFGWGSDLGAVGGRPLAARLAQRAEDLACIARLRDPAHRWHDAYVRLCEPVSGPIGFQDGAQLRVQIAQLLNGIRLHHPEVELELDAGQVAMWDRALGPKRQQALDERSDRISWYGWLVLGWLALNVVNFSVQALS